MHRSKLFLPKLVPELGLACYNVSYEEFGDGIPVHTLSLIQEGIMLLFLGAGASTSFGIPDTKGFISEFESKIGDNQIYKKLKSGISDEIFDTEVLMTVLHDLSKSKEELLSSIAPHTTRLILEQGKASISYFTEDEDLKLACRNILREIKDMIRNRCETQVKDKKAQILEYYDTFWESLNIQKGYPAGNKNLVYPPSSIFTTNYDACIERYFNARQSTISRGFIEKFNEPVLDINQLLQQKSEIELVKLHGSVDWFSKDGKIRSFPAAGVINTSRITYLGDEYGSEVMLYPVESSTSNELTRSPFIEQLYIFKNRLNANRTWIIIGSTFRDLTLASIMNDVIMQKIEKEYHTVLHINPQATQINEYLTEKGYGLLAQVIKPIDDHFISEAVVDKLKAHQLPT